MLFITIVIVKQPICIVIRIASPPFGSDYKFTTLTDSRALGIDELTDELLQSGEEVIFLGDGVPVFRDVIIEKLGDAAAFAPAHLSRQRAASVAVLGGEMYLQGETVSSDEFAPVYLRKSQAEREAE